MALSESVYSNILYGKLTKYHRGYLLKEFCDAVGHGVVGQTILQTGQIASPVNNPVSSGVGIVTISATNIADIIYATCQALWGSRGPALYDFCLAIGQTTVEHYAVASLTSDANGTSQYPSFAGAISPMANLIEGYPRWAGRPYWIRMCTAIATGICSETAANGTSTLSGASIPPPGSGVVVIS